MNIDAIKGYANHQNAVLKAEAVLAEVDNYANFHYMITVNSKGRFIPVAFHIQDPNMNAIMLAGMGLAVIV